MSDLFESHTAKHTTILLIDASGSVIQNKFNDVLIFDQIKIIINELNETEYRVIFWNSDKNAEDFFKGGVYKLPFIVKKNTLDQAFMFVRKHIKNTCLTFPHLAFDSISDDWIKNTDLTKIYFITDGEMGYSNISSSDKNILKVKLSNSIQRLFAKSNVQLHIITIEPKNMDFTQMETLEKAAGCDVFNVISESRLTNYITKFVSYTPNNLNGFVHLSKNIPPAGYVPFGEKYFSEFRTNEFITYLADLITSTNAKDDADDHLLQIVQSLSSTICVLIKDKPAKIVEDITKTFCKLFENTVLDNMFVKFILTDAIQRELDGMANVFAAYRSQLKNLYKQANDLLQKNVKDAIGINDQFISFPIDNKIITGSFRLIDKNLTINKVLYPQAAILSGNVHLPILPFNGNNSAINEQCLRQWMRLLVQKMYHVDTMGDIVIYIMLATLLRIVISDGINDDVKNSYRQLATIMLQKKRTNSDATEISKFEDGELPIPNTGKIETFYTMMEKINEILRTKLQPMTLWYCMCLALDNDRMITKQLIHCKDSIEKDFPGTDPIGILSNIKSMLTPITHYDIPFENILDYSCLIIGEDISKVGGFRFLPHKNIVGSACSPIYVLSIEGHAQLIANQETSVCPICYARLTEASFEKVGPKPQPVDFFAEKTFDVFGNVVPKVHQKFSATLTFNKKGSLIIMKGTIGSGKTKSSMMIKNQIEKRDGYCFVVGTDKYCKSGKTISEAIMLIREELSEINDLEDNNKNLFVVIDTCGEKQPTNIIFECDFTGWSKVNYWPNLIRSEMMGYFAWSLRNVLRRGKPSIDDNYYFNMIDAGTKTCIEVHKKKIIALFGKKSVYLKINFLDSCSEVLSKINDLADAYQTKLDTLMPLDDKITAFVETLIKIEK